MSQSPKTAEAILTRAWMQRGPLACLLWPLSLLFALLIRLRRAAFALGLKQSTRLPVPVIVVGNVFIGGTGKTPFAIWLIEALRAAGYTPGLISRGYGGRQSSAADGSEVREVDAGSKAREVGDEPLLIALRTACPVVVGRRRVAAAQRLLAAHPQVDVIVSDDGLQHYALGRDIEIVLSDARGAGNGWLLPAGPLREPATRRRDFSVVNLPEGAAPPSGAFAMSLHGETAQQLADPSQQMRLAAIADKGGIAAVAGIGNPARFFTTLRQAGLSFAEVALPDHHDYSDNPFAALTQQVILITEKDAVKCKAIEAIKNDPRIWVVPVTARIDGALAEHIVEKLRERPTA